MVEIIIVMVMVIVIVIVMVLVIIMHHLMSQARSLVALGFPSAGLSIVSGSSGLKLSGQDLGRRPTVGRQDCQVA